MSLVIVDYGSGNLRSVQKSFAHMGAEAVLSSDPATIARADRIVLPGVGAFAHCRDGIAPVIEALQEAVLTRAVPFFGICVGMQLMADSGDEFGVHSEGLGWIPGHVGALTPEDPTCKIPHMGWNTLDILAEHPVLQGISSGDHVYFVHSFHLTAQDPAHLLARADHGGALTAMVGRDNMIGTQFHPEKSQKTGLRLIENFLGWHP